MPKQGRRMGEFERLAATLDGWLIRGDFRRAVPVVNRLVCEKSTAAERARLSRLGPESKVRQRVSAAIAEVLAYQGYDETARSWLTPWTDPSLDPLVACPRLSEVLPARARLQAAEYMYSMRAFDPAEHLARAILDTCAANGDAWGQGEASWHLARCAIRVHEFDRAVRHSDEAIQRFSAASQAPHTAVQWRLGLAHLVSGFANWRLGQPALARLLTARSLLSRCGDYLARAHVEHTIGSAQRSAGRPHDLARALESFDRARRTYERPVHHLHLARLNTNVGRTYADMLEFEKAARHLRDALTNAAGMEDQVAGRRQQAETLVYLSWLQQRGPDPNLEEAERSAVSALSMVGSTTTSIRLEALIARGSCLLAAGRDLSEATRCFDVVLREAKSPKIRANAELRLAERYCAGEGASLASAIEHWRRASEILSVIEPGRYLSERLAELERLIRRTFKLLVFHQSELFDAGSPPGSAAPAGATERATRSGTRLSRLRAKLDEWIVGQLERDPDRFPTLKARAEALGITPAGYILLRRRVWRPAQAEPSAEG